ncbi:substrate-binding domain-containing protein [Methylobacterium sp. P5_C11]
MSGLIGGATRAVAVIFACLFCAIPASATTIAVAMAPPVGLTRLLHRGLEEHASARGIALDFAYAPDGAGEQQVAQVRSFVAAKVDALLVMPVDRSASDAITRLALEADIPLVFLEIGAETAWATGRVVVVAPNDLVAGRLQMRKLAQMLNGTGRVAILTGLPSRPGSMLRTRGVKEVLTEFPSLRLVAEAAAASDRTMARAVVAGWLARGLAVDAIVAGDDAMALGAAEAVEAAGTPAGRTLIGGVGATADGMQAMQTKRLAVTIYQDAVTQSRRALDDALALMRHEPVPHVDWVPFELVTDRMSTTHFSR